jgi:hypothetical protein
MTDNEKRAHDFAMAVVQDRLARDEKCQVPDLIGEYNVAYSEMLDELNKQ